MWSEKVTFTLGHLGELVAVSNKRHVADGGGHRPALGIGYAPDVRSRILCADPMLQEPEARAGPAIGACRRRTG